MSGINYQITNPKYVWNEEFDYYKNLAEKAGVTVEDIGKEISEIAEKNGTATPKDIVDKARNNDSAMHDIIFRKNTEEAAEAWYEGEARNLANSIRIRICQEETKADGTTSQVIKIVKAFDHLSTEPRLYANSYNICK